MNKKRKTVVLIILLLILNYLCFINSVQATTEKIGNIYSIGDCGSLLKYKGIVVKTYYAEYINEGKVYPAYCLDKTKQGVNDDISYSVNIQETIKEVGLWRTIINGYPYVSYQDLGCVNKEEAFTATKQAVYCYIHGNKVEDYEAIGEAGVRTLNALKKIVENSQKSNITNPSNIITINRGNNQWQVDEINKEYVSKTYSIKTEASIQKYSIEIPKEREDILVTDIKNEIRNEFNLNEKFKVLIPIKSMKQDGEITINVKANLETKPILYGKSSDNNYQDYALTMATYEEGENNIKEKYSINETEIEIIKKDEETNKPMKDVEFCILDSNKNILYKNLKTNDEGKAIVENLIPGTYYIQEQNTLDGYETVEELIKIDVDWMEKYTVVVNNRKFEEPEIEKKETSIIKTTEVKRLPKTGM